MLKDNHLGEHIRSISGSSTGSLVAAIWASGHEDGPYAKIFGKNLSPDFCQKNTCAEAEQYYSNFLDAPIMGEIDGVRSFATDDFVDAWGQNFYRPFQRQPSREESYVTWSWIKHWLNLMGVKKKFNETQIPVVVSALHRSSNSKTELLMNEGDLHLAVMGGCSTPGNTQPVQVNSKYSALDGYYGDEHGLLGYDTLQKDIKPRSILNIVFVDTIGQVAPMNFTKLRTHSDLKSAATVFVSVGHPLLYVNAARLKKMGGLFVKHRDMVGAVHAGFTHVLSTPLKLANAEPTNNVKSYYADLDTRPFLPPFPQPADRALTEMENQFSQWREKLGHSEFTREFRVEGQDVFEAVDHSNLHSDKELQKRFSVFEAALGEMFAGKKYVPFEQTTAYTKRYIRLQGEGTATP